MNHYKVKYVDKANLSINRVSIVAAKHISDALVYFNDEYPKRIAFDIELVECQGYG